MEGTETIRVSQGKGLGANASAPHSRRFSEVSGLELSLEGGVGWAEKCGLRLRKILAQLEEGILKAVDHSQAILSGFGWPSLGLLPSQAFMSPFPILLSLGRIIIVIIFVITV